MCRIAAYVGPPVPLARLLYEPAHSLEVQSYRPREMLSGTVNVDGTGVAWWPPDSGEEAPLRYVTEKPPWSDSNLPLLARRLRGAPILATVRSATPGIGGGEGAVLPFTHGALAGSHNGYLGRFRESTCAALLARLPADLLGGLDTVTDSALLFLLAVEAWRVHGDPARAAEEAVGVAGEAARRANAPASLNLVLATAQEVVAVRHAVELEPNTLYVREAEAGYWLASEPLDGDRESWRAVPHDAVVTLDRRGIQVRPAALREPREKGR